MFSTLGIDEEFDQEHDQSSIVKDHSISVNKKKAKTKRKKNPTMLNLTNILQSYDADNHSDDAGDTDEVDEYFKMKLLINNDESILKWWKERSLIFPK